MSMNKKKVFFIVFPLLLIAAIGATVLLERNSQASVKKYTASAAYRFPDYYRGIYLNSEYAKKPKRFLPLLEMSKRSGINVMVMDVQTSRYTKSMVPAENVKKCIENGIHPVARIVVFPKGLQTYPASEEYLRQIIALADEACRAGFREIQFDYIRFSDEKRHREGLRHVKLKMRYEYISSILTKARKALGKYNVRIAADIFGRIPHTDGDRIGQKMEYLDGVADIICPMAYPSHYWTRKLRNDPYGTVKWTATEADRLTEKAEIVLYIQAFEMKIPRDMSFVEYLRLQLKAVDEAEIKGFILWNAKQQYETPLKVVTSYYASRNAKH